ncbi:uncharacterized protein B0I36DRAFT_355699 [Microdochium trichocladiopsis]|uniref:Uncharacterized protein n=1 Tax=Microdochium trichocladiopsis TaxID=1682393 RepID=A0A9P8XTW4_9PEZI|nr:uncharacterized protein B0I36DRAFT_355699 [Microdochium trichocladiopsis]KAH7014496.1 hypothetical protein B0I36DRAFT_355699 [Microdochium trichocladiopsis]
MAPPESSQDPSQSDGQQASSSSSAAPANPEVQSAYNDLRRLIPMLASELDQLRAALREHNLWLQRYGHSAAAPSQDPFTANNNNNNTQTGPPSGGDHHPAAVSPSELNTTTATSASTNTAISSSTATTATTPQTPAASDLPSYSGVPELPGYSASDVPPYTGGPNSVSLMASSASTSTREEVEHRRDELTNWLAEGEDTLREYSARFAQLGEELGVSPPEDVLGTWNEASPDNALPDYAQVETREELMVGGVGEVPPPYVRGMALEKVAS